MTHNYENTGNPRIIYLPYTDLQMWADYGLALGKLKVFPHEKIQQGSCLRLGGARTMVTALKDLVAQTATQVCLTLEERTGELQREMRPQVRKTSWTFTCMFLVCMEFAGPFAQRASEQRRRAAEWQLIGWSGRRASRCPAPSSSMHFVLRPAKAASERMNKGRIRLKTRLTSNF